MEIVDSQVHANQICRAWRTAPIQLAIEEAVVAMDAVGVNAVVIDEWTGFDAEGHLLPGHVGPGGAWRQDCSFASTAVSLHPERFAFVARVDEADPELTTLISGLRRQPGCVGLRLTSQVSNVDGVEAGAYQVLFELAEEHQIPLFINVSRQPEVIVPVLLRHPKLWLIQDHCGVIMPDSSVEGPERFAGLQKVVELAEYPNVGLKWSHVERLSGFGFPFDDLMPYFRTVVDAYGADRIMWASDYTQSRRASAGHPTSWAGLLHYLLDSTWLTTKEKEAVLGGSVRRILQW